MTQIYMKITHLKVIKLLEANELIHLQLENMDVYLAL